MSTPDDAGRDAIKRAREEFNNLSSFWANKAWTSLPEGQHQPKYPDGFRYVDAINNPIPKQMVSGFDENDQPIQYQVEEEVIGFYSPITPEEFSHIQTFAIENGILPRFEVGEIIQEQFIKNRLYLTTLQKEKLDSLIPQYIEQEKKRLGAAYPAQGAAPAAAAAAAPAAAAAAGAGVHFAAHGGAGGGGGGGGGDAALGAAPAASKAEQKPKKK